MKTEHRNKQILSYPKFLARLSKYALFAMVLIIFSVALGTLGYHAYAGLSWLDSFYMACMILTGMGPVAELSAPAAKLFSSFYALYSGVAFLSITAVFFAPVAHRLLHILHVEEENP